MIGGFFLSPALLTVTESLGEERKHMSLIRDNWPYTKPGLEKLAVAMGVNSAYLWVNPSNNAFSLREAALKASTLVLASETDTLEEQEEM